VTGQQWRGTIRFAPKRLFAGDAPESLTVEGATFAAPIPPKVKLTKEERAALPKLSEAEKIVKAEEAIAKRKAKLAAAAK